MEKIKNIPFWLILNIFIIAFIYFIIIYAHSYHTLVNHDYIYPWDPSFAGRLPSHIYSFTLLNFLPNLLNISPNDFCGNFGIGTYLISGIYLTISILFCIGFFLTKDCSLKNLLKKKEFALILPISFLLITIPFCEYDLTYFDYFRTNDIAETSEYFFSFLPLLFFFTYTYISVFSIDNIKNNPLLLLSGIFFSFIVGAYNEVFNLTAFFSLMLFILFLLIFDKEKLKASLIQYPTFSLFAGMFTYYILMNKSMNIIHSYNQSLRELYQNALIYFPDFISNYYQMLIERKFIYFSIILLTIILIFTTKKKEQYNSIYFSFSILLGYLIMNFSMFLVSGMTHVTFLFQRHSFDIIWTNILEYSIIILLGSLYWCVKQKRIILVISMILLTFLSKTFIDIQGKIQNEKYEIKRMVYLIDKYNLIYSTLGETTILPKSFLSNENLYHMLFKFDNNYLNGKSNEEIKEFFEDRYFNDEYYQYRSYFEVIYKKKFIGVTYKEDKIANEEIQKRLTILDEKLETNEELKKNKLSFKAIYKKYKGKKYSSEELLSKEKEIGNSSILNKALGFSYIEEGNFEKSLLYYKKYLETNPTDYDANINVANIYKEKNEFTEAEKHLLKIKKLDHKNFEVSFLLLNLYLYDIKNKQKAITLCNEMINTEPKMFSLYVNKAIVLSTFGDYDKAEKVIKESYKVNNGQTSSRIGNKTMQEIKDIPLIYPEF